MSRTAAMALVWILTGICGILWGCVYVWFSLSRASMPPLLYSAVCFLGFLALRVINKFHVTNIESSVFAFRQLQLILILAMPVVMHIILGGLANSSASCVMSWSIIAPAGAIFYSHRPRSLQRNIAKTSRAASIFRHTLSSVFADRYVSLVILADILVISVVIIIDPLLPSVEPPPLVLRQVSSHKTF